MANLARMRVTWTGSAVIGGGVTTFYTTLPTSGFATAVKNFYTALAPLVPTTCTWTIPHSGDTITDSAGALSGVWSEAGADDVVVSTLAGAYANGVGARVVLKTAGIRGGRRVNGSIFVVPLALGSYQSDGTLVDANVTTIRNAAAALVAAVPLYILSKHHKGTSDGQSSLVTSSTVPDKVSWLRSRRT